MDVDKGTLADRTEAILRSDRHSLRRTDRPAPAMNGTIHPTKATPTESGAPATGTSDSV